MIGSSSRAEDSLERSVFFILIIPRDILVFMTQLRWCSTSPTTSGCRSSSDRGWSTSLNSTSCPEATTRCTQSDLVPPFLLPFEKLMRLLELVQFLDGCNASESLKKWHTLNQGYNSSVNPTIANVFGAAAFRWSKKFCFSFFFRHVMNLEFQKKKKRSFFLLFLINIYRLKLRLQVWPLSGEE